MTKLENTNKDLNNNDSIDNNSCYNINSDSSVNNNNSNNNNESNNNIINSDNINNNNNYKIDIYLINNSDALVWNTEDIYIIRKRYRIVGSLLGSVENFKNLSTINSIPLLLSSYEIRLGLENGWFRLINESCDYPTVSNEDIVLFNKEREEKYKLQIDGFIENKIQKEKEYRSKNQHLNKKNKLNNSDSISSNSNSNCNNNNNEQSQQSLIDQQQTINKSIDNSDDEYNKRKIIEKEKILNNFKSFNNDIYIYTSTKEAIENEPFSKVWRDKRKVNELKLQDFQFPSNQDEVLKYTVYKDLWSRGYYISGGSKFGGTFLIYRGDPFLYHATFIVVLKQYTQEFQALDLLTSSRLAVHVNKTTLFASINSQTNKPDYISINWKGVT